MTQGDELLAGILQHPDDTDRRLVYADWLEEDGEAARAEFIRVQCALASAPRNPHGNCSYCGVMGDNHRDGCRAGRLRRRERELLWEHSLDWFEQWFGPQGGVQFPHGTTNVVEAWPWEDCTEWSPFVFRRGFIEHVTLTAADWLAHAPALLASQPVREVALTSWPEMAVWYTDAEVPSNADDRRKATLRQLGREWPGVKFALPEPVGGFLVPPEFTDGMLEAMRSGETLVGEPIDLERILVNARAAPAP